MNENGSSGKPFLSRQGKGLVIGLVVFFSVLSFILGYFVGKIGKDHSTDFSHRRTEVPISQTLTQPMPTPSANPEVLKTTPVQMTTQPSENLATTLQPKAPLREEEIPAVVTKKTQKEPLHKSAKETKKAVSSREKNRKTAVLYTVQVGALKSETEADNLKTKLDKKGYKTIIMTAKTKTGERIFKIRTGEFRDRKDAEILALRLKRNEGLNTFVTFRE